MVLYPPHKPHFLAYVLLAERAACVRALETVNKLCHVITSWLVCLAAMSGPDLTAKPGVRSLKLARSLAAFSPLAASERREP